MIGARGLGEFLAGGSKRSGETYAPDERDALLQLAHGVAVAFDAVHISELETRRRYLPAGDLSASNRPPAQPTRDRVWFCVKSCRKVDAFSLTEIARATGLSPAACSRFRTGARVPIPVIGLHSLP